MQSIGDAIRFGRVCIGVHCALSHIGSFTSTCTTRVTSATFGHGTLLMGVFASIAASFSFGGLPCLAGFLANLRPKDKWNRALTFVQVVQRMSLLDLHITALDCQLAVNLVAEFSQDFAWLKVKCILMNLCWQTVGALTPTCSRSSSSFSIPHFGEDPNPALESCRQ